MSGAHMNVTKGEYVRLVLNFRVSITISLYIKYIFIYVNVYNFSIEGRLSITQQVTHTMDTQLPYRKFELFFSLIPPAILYIGYIGRSSIIIIQIITKKSII